MSKNDQLSPKQQKLIEALLTCDTVLEACEVAKVASSTAYHWLQEPAFKAAYDEAKKAVFTQSLNALLSVPVDAIATLKRNLSAETPNAQQVAAAKILLEKAVDIYKVTELEARLSDLEAKLKERG